MSPRAARAPLVRIRVRYSDSPSPLSTLARSRLRASVEGYARRLVKDLDVPARVYVRLEPRSDMPELEGRRAISMEVGGQRARMPLAADFAPSSGSLPRSPASGSEAAESEREIACRIARTVYDNRELLVNAASLKAMRAAWWPEWKPSSGAAPDTLARLLREICRLNLRLSRLPSELPDPEALAGGGMRAYSEALFRTRQSCDVVLRVHLPASRSYAYRSALAVSEGPGAFASVQRRFFERLGLLLPKPVPAEDRDLEEDELQLRINDVRLPCSTLGGRDLEEGRGWGFPAMEQELLRESRALLAPLALERSLVLLAKFAPRLVERFDETVGRPLLFRVLGALVEEAVSIADLRGILDTLVMPAHWARADFRNSIVFPIDSWDPYYRLSSTRAERTPGLEASLGLARIGLKRQISRTFAGDRRHMKAYLLASDLESLLEREAPISDEEKDRIVEATHEATRKRPPAPILTTTVIRRRLWNLLHRELPAISVVAYEELSADTQITALPRISMA